MFNAIFTPNIKPDFRPDCLQISAGSNPERSMGGRGNLRQFSPGIAAKILYTFL
jgi:hypothetical protein